MQYRIIKEKSLETLEQEVNAALAEGWVPTGGPMNTVSYTHLTLPTTPYV